MSDRRFHLGWSTSAAGSAWNDPLGSAPEPRTGELHLGLARPMERACFGDMPIEDALSIPSVHGGSRGR